MRGYKSQYSTVIDFMIRKSLILNFFQGYFLPFVIHKRIWHLIKKIESMFLFQQIKGTSLTSMKKYLDDI